MNKKDDESWINIIVPIILIAVAVFWLFDFSPKTERLKTLMSEINSSKVH